MPARLLTLLILLLGPMLVCSTGPERAQTSAGEGSRQGLDTADGGPFVHGAAASGELVARRALRALIRSPRPRPARARPPAGLGSTRVTSPSPVATMRFLVFLADMSKCKGDAYSPAIPLQELESLILGSGGSAGGGGGGTVRSGAGGGSSTGSSPSLAGFLKECSGGVSGIDAANSKVLSVALPCSGRDESAGGRSWAIDGCSEANMDGWMDAARRAAASAHGLDPSDYDKHLMVLPRNMGDWPSGDCGFAGLATVGPGIGPQGVMPDRIWIAGEMARDLKTYAHELAHAWGFKHSTAADLCEQCDPSTPLGGWGGSALRCYNAPQQWALGWQREAHEEGDGNSSGLNAADLQPGQTKVFTLALPDASSAVTGEQPGAVAGVGSTSPVIRIRLGAPASTRSGGGDGGNAGGGIASKGAALYISVRRNRQPLATNPYETPFGTDINAWTNSQPGAPPAVTTREAVTVVDPWTPGRVTSSQTRSVQLGYDAPNAAVLIHTWDGGELPQGVRGHLRSVTAAAEAAGSVSSAGPTVLHALLSGAGDAWTTASPRSADVFGGASSSGAGAGRMGYLSQALPGLARGPLVVRLVSPVDLAQLPAGRSGVAVRIAVCRPSAAAEGPGTCNDGLDNDCDGVADEEDPDCRGYTSEASPPPPRKASLDSVPGAGGESGAEPVTTGSEHAVTRGVGNAAAEWESSAAGEEASEGVGSGVEDGAEEGAEVLQVRKLLLRK